MVYLLYRLLCRLSGQQRLSRQFVQRDCADCVINKICADSLINRDFADSLVNTSNYVDCLVNGNFQDTVTDQLEFTFKKTLGYKC